MIRTIILWMATASFVVVDSTDIYRRGYNAYTKRPTSCNILELNEKMGNLQYNISCNDGSNSTEVAVGVQCTISYDCLFDQPDVTKTTSYVCDHLSRWIGTLPQCDVNDHIVQYVINSLAEATNVNENEIDQSYNENVEKSNNNTLLINSLNEYCILARFCSLKESKRICRKATFRPYVHQDQQEVLVALIQFCKYCFKKCAKSNQSITLL